MHRKRTFRLLLLAGVLQVTSSWAGDSAPADPSWKHKPLAQWNDEESKDVLANSPWVKFATPVWLRDLSPDERRESGDWEATEGHGVGWEALLGLFGGSERAKAAIARAHAKPPVDAVMIRWESALPIRTAEKKVGETGVPVGNGEYYAIAVYDIPTPKKFNLANELKDVAYIRRDKKKDFKPARVEILRQDAGKATVVYLFPRSVEISKRDGWLVFAAQIGRLFVTQNFFAGEMLLRDELEL
jgi:hypothetical protein